MLPNSNETSDLVPFTEKILNGKLYILCSGLKIGYEVLEGAFIIRIFKVFHNGVKQGRIYVFFL